VRPSPGRRQLGHDLPRGDALGRRLPKAFKHGAFTLAQRAKVPLLPIVVEGTSPALPKHGFVLRGRHAIRIRILPEIPVEHVVATPLEPLIAETRAVFARELGQTIEDAASPAVPAAAGRSG
jgi:1-acyl-sn-glycerol-3-phosphate acyltransferase